ncbi:MAG: M48 family metalloprotease [Methylobacteriaceae bacterium]|nr:M48 family metalloprotease [Methylobacteriaceae bacterium]
MMRATGFYAHVRANHLRSLALFLVFAALFELLAGAMLAASVARRAFSPEARAQGLSFVVSAIVDLATPALLIFPLTGCAIWVVVAWLFYRPVLARSIGARRLERKDDPALFDLVETQALALGLPTPAIHIVDSEAMNAFAAGLTRRGAMLGLTRGLIAGLPREELETVIAHELIHIRHGDARLIGLATICAGVAHRMAFLIVWNNLRPGLRMIALLALGAMFVWEALALVVWAAIAAGAVALMTRLAIVRARDFIADAEAARMTKNPQALATALRRIAPRDRLDNIDVGAQAMMFSWTTPTLAPTHADVAARIEALARLAPGMVAPAPAPTAPAAAGWRETLAALRAPEWVSHPYILAPAVAANLALFLVLDAGVGFRRIDLTPRSFDTASGQIREIEAQIGPADASRSGIRTLTSPSVSPASPAPASR